MGANMRWLFLLAAFAALCTLLSCSPASALASRASVSSLKHQHQHRVVAKRASEHTHAHEKEAARGPADDADEDYEDDDDDDDGNGSEYDDNPPRFDENKFYNGREVFRRRKNAHWRRRRVLPTIYSSASVPPQTCQCGGAPVRCGSPCHRRKYVKAPYTYVSPLSNTPAAQSVSDGKNVFTRYNGVYASSADVPSSSSYIPSPAASPSLSSSSSGDNPNSYFGRDYFSDWGHIGSYLYKSAEERRKEMLERLGPKPRISDALRHVDQLNHHYVRRQRLHDIWAYLKKHENDHYDYEELAEDMAPSTSSSCSAPSCPSLSVSGCQEESCNRNDENYR